MRRRERVSQRREMNGLKPKAVVSSATVVLAIVMWMFPMAGAAPPLGKPDVGILGIACLPNDPNIGLGGGCTEILEDSRRTIHGKVWANAFRSGFPGEVYHKDTTHCQEGYYYATPSLGAYWWNDMISSSSANFDACQFMYLWEHENFLGSEIACNTDCTTMGSMNDRASSLQVWPWSCGVQC